MTFWEAVRQGLRAGWEDPLGEHRAAALREAKAEARLARVGLNRLLSNGQVSRWYGKGELRAEGSTVSRLLAIAQRALEQVNRERATNSVLEDQVAEARCRLKEKGALEKHFPNGVPVNHGGYVLVPCGEDGKALLDNVQGWQEHVATLRTKLEHWREYYRKGEHDPYGDLLDEETTALLEWGRTRFPGRATTGVVTLTKEDADRPGHYDER